MEVHIYYRENAPREEYSELFAASFCRYTGLGPAALPAVGRMARGKPYFPDHPRLHFNISHTGSLWACAWGSLPLGLDVQETGGSGRESAIARRFFHPSEQAYVEEQGSPGFYAIWCAKESYCKYTGAGIGGDFSAFSVVREMELRGELADCHLRPIEMPGAVAACLCTGEPVDILRLTAL